MKGSRWTKEEETYLEMWHGVMDQRKIAAHLGKSVGSVREKSRRMGLGNLEEVTDKMTCSNVARIVGVHRKTVNTNWVNMGLKTKKINRYRMVSGKDLFDFLQKNLNLWDARKCDYYYFCQYDWFQKKLAEDKKNKCQYQKPWTDYEVRTLLSMRNRGVRYKVIAQHLARTEGAVYKKYNLLMEKQQMMKTG